MTATVADIVNAAIHTYGGASAPTLGDEWQKLNPDISSNAKEGGYYGEAWLNRSTGELIIANRGTDPGSWHNFIANGGSDVKLGVGSIPDAVGYAKDFALKAIDAANRELAGSGVNLSATYTAGHSLGGYESQQLAAYLSSNPSKIGDASLVNISLDAPGIASSSLSGEPNLLQSEPASLRPTFGVGAQREKRFLSGKVVLQAPPLTAIGLQQEE